MKTPEEQVDEGFEKGVYGITPQELDAKAEQAVRYSLAKGEYRKPDDDSYKIVLAWLDLRALRRDKVNLVIAIIAIILSAIAIIPQIIELLQWVLSK